MRRKLQLAMLSLVAGAITACAAPGNNSGSQGECPSGGYETRTSGSVGAGYSTEKGQITSFGVGFHFVPRPASDSGCDTASASSPQFGVSLFSSTESDDNG